MKPRIPLHSLLFDYRPSYDTDIRRLFKRVRREMAEAAKATKPAAVVRPIRKQEGTK